MIKEGYSIGCTIFLTISSSAILASLVPSNIAAEIAAVTDDQQPLAIIPAILLCFLYTRTASIVVFSLPLCPCVSFLSLYLLFFLCIFSNVSVVLRFASSLLVVPHLPSTSS